MAHDEGHRWSRARYPLQMHTEHLVQPHHSAQQADRVNAASTARNSNSAHALTTLNPRHEAEGLRVAQNSIKSSEEDHQNHVSPSTSSYSRGSYPMQAVTEASGGDYEQQAIHTSNPDQSKVVKRTLRRAPRSERLNQLSSESLRRPSSSGGSSIGGIESSPPPVEPSQIEESSSFSRQVYPLQKVGAGSTAQCPVAHGESLGAIKETEEGSTGSPSSNGGLTSTQPSTWTSTIPPFSSPVSEADPANSHKNSDEHLDASPTQQNRQSLRKSAYPLQAPASLANLRDLPTPPASPERQQAPEAKQPPTQSPEKEHESPPTKQFRRQVYPMQTPASTSDLRGPSTPPPSPPKDAPEDARPSTTQVQENEHAPGSTTTFRRNLYPASVTSLRRPTTPPASLDASPTRETATPTDPAREEQATTSSRVFRHAGYPSQSPASVMNMGSSSPAEHTRVEANSVADEEESKPLEDSDQSSSVRQTYPLQPQLSIPSLQVSAPPSESIGVQQSTEMSSREHELATRVTKQWRRGIYPMQSPDNDSPFYRSPTPQPPEDRKQQKPGPIHLPRHIKAIQDTDNQEPIARGRTIVVCLDGTGDKFDGDNSNIVHIISALKKDDPNQISYYQSGIGTYSAGGSLSSGISSALDMAVGSELGLHVRDAYQFLMHTYQEGDRICIFGFSRGAYTARCLAGMIHKVGLLPPRNLQQIAFAYEFYKNDTEEGWNQAQDFKATFCTDVYTHFLGCFDSVASVGFIPRRLPLSTTPTNKPRYFRHAMALDERRAKFKVCRHQVTDYDTEEQDDTPPWASQLEETRTRYGDDYHPNITDEEYERLTEGQKPFDTDVLEVWFTGAHADVGGGAVSNDERHKLAQIPLRWMIRQAFECNTGIIFKTKILAEFGLDVHTLWPKYTALTPPSHLPPPSFLEKFEHKLPPRSIRRSKLVPTDSYDKGERMYHFKSHTDEDWTPEQVEDFYDAMAPMNEQLTPGSSWWVLEMWPVQYKVPVAPGQVKIVTGMNLGRYRGIDDFEPNLHWTVRHREQHLGYRIQARTAPHTKWKIVV